MKTCGYHVTPKAMIPAILAQGLLPAIGQRSQEQGEVIPRIYFFPDMDACSDALGNWLGECFEDDELVILEVDLAGMQTHSEVGYELTVDTHVLSTRILRILDEPGQ